jgi:hypothetical protein
MMDGMMNYMILRTMSTFVKGGARKREEHGCDVTRSTTPNKNVAAIRSKEKGKRTKSTDNGIGKSRKK